MNENIVYAKDARPQKHPKIFAVPFDTTKISLPMAMDLSLESGITDDPLISFGYMDYWVEQHVYWRHDNLKGAQVRELSSDTLKFGFDLFLEADADKYRGYESTQLIYGRNMGQNTFIHPVHRPCHLVNMQRFVIRPRSIIRAMMSRKALLSRIESTGRIWQHGSNGNRMGYPWVA